MHLLNVHTRRLETFLDDSRTPQYAILSHTWGDDEVTFQDLSDIVHARTKRGYHKIRLTCRQAISDGLFYAWVDTCCIDKTSSAELSEAINSMFNWYAKSHICYAFLEDVPALAGGPGSLVAPVTRPLAIANYNEASLSEEARQFVTSKWFTRGWTLQELLAPPHIRFYGQSWEEIGSLRATSSSYGSADAHDLISLISHATKIPRSIVAQRSSFKHSSVAKRMSWAASRQTTRQEDEAYCLLGIFGVNMPLLYGEGYRAFTRLQEEIAKTSDDHSILIWDREEAHVGGAIFAPRVRYFALCSQISQRVSQLAGSYSVTKRGLEITVQLQRYRDWYLGLLDCFDERKPGDLVVLELASIEGGYTGRRAGKFMIHSSRIQTTRPLNALTLKVHLVHESDPVLGRLYLQFYEGDHTFRKFHCPDEQILLETAQPRPANANKKSRADQWSVRIRAAFPPLEWDLRAMSCTESTEVPHADADGLTTWSRRAVVLDLFCCSIEPKTNTIRTKSYPMYLVFEYATGARGLTGWTREGISSLCIGKYRGEDIAALCESVELDKVRTGRLHTLCPTCNHATQVSFHLNETHSTLAISIGAGKRGVQNRERFKHVRDFLVLLITFFLKFFARNPLDSIQAFLPILWRVFASMFCLVCCCRKRREHNDEEAQPLQPFNGEEFGFEDCPVRPQPRKAFKSAGQVPMIAETHFSLIVETSRDS